MRQSGAGSPGPRPSGRGCHGRRGGTAARRGSAQPPFWQRAGGRLGSGRPAAVASPGALLPTPRRGAPGLLFPPGAVQGRLKWTPRCASPWFELVPSSPQRLPTKWRTPPLLPPPPPPPPRPAAAAPPGAMSAADTAPSPTGQEGARSRGGAARWGKAAAARGQVPSPGLRAQPGCPLGEQLPLSTLRPSSTHGAGPGLAAPPGGGIFLGMGWGRQEASPASPPKSPPFHGEAEPVPGGCGARRERAQGGDGCGKGRPTCARCRCQTAAGKGDKEGEGGAAQPGR